MVFLRNCRAWLDKRDRGYRIWRQLQMTFGFYLRDLLRFHATYFAGAFAMRYRQNHVIAGSKVRAAVLSVAFVAGLIFAAPAAHAAFLISSAATKNAGCYESEYGLTCAPVATGSAVLNVTALENLLVSYNVTVQTGSATDDVIINTALSWTGPSTLAFVAQRSITINAHVSDAGTGELVLDTGTTGQLSFGPGGNVGFPGTAGSLVINNQGYQLVTSIASLVTWADSNPADYIALAANYDAKPDGTYAQAPVQSTFTGRFEGLGNTISNFSVVDSIAGDYVGLFAQMQGGTIENVRLANVSVHATGNSTSYSTVGGLVGYNRGTLFGDSVSGKVTGSYVYAGGLAGGQGYGSTTNSFSTATVMASKATTAGGLLGYQVNSAQVDHSYATGNVTGGYKMFVGGLIGYNTEVVSYSYATGAVTGRIAALVGGLIGYNWGGTISKSWATGSATVGAGCCGENTAAGGLVGSLGGGTIAQSYATGSATGGSGADAGGLAGLNFGVIDNSYATGPATTSGSWVGGLVGYNDSTVSASYSTGHVSQGCVGCLGGLLGGDGAASGSLKHTYWDTTTSGVANPSQGAGSPANDPGIKPESSVQLKSALPVGFNTSLWGEASGVNGGLPYLLAVPPK